ncbi:MAG: molecular chaperone HtpG [Acidobacteria bacterium]|jgi:molecular chaperone HtpG|nr:molecular chaperone HtpG [Acidobacteriota bacterium]
MTAEKEQTFEFQSEVKQLLDILVYSLYKNKEVFLRELVSNAADALNKMQFEFLTVPDLEGRDQELKITIAVDKKHGKLVIEDNGVGMTREELVQNIGTIAHSGTLDYLKRLQESQAAGPADLIGKFGVGFYSSFMVAKEIHITTRSWQKDGKAWLWKSTGESNYTIEASEKEGRGTRIELLLKKDEKEFLETFRLKNIILKHSKFVAFPIYMDGEKIERRDAVWTQPRSKLAEKDYGDFYKFLENTQEEPETWLHLSSDAPVQFHALLYVPKTSFELLGLMKTEPGVDLYSRKVLIQKGSKEIMPEYLRFVKGIIDSEEIPLNISRETFQNNVRIDKIRKHVVKKLLEHLENVKNKERDKYLAIWKNFSKNLKEGAVNDFDNREKLAALLLFSSSRTQGDALIDLKEYVGRMTAGQSEIYFLGGADRQAIEKNPALEIFRKKDHEVLYLTDPLDEFVLDHLHEFEKKPFKMAESADIALEEKAAAGDEAAVKDAENLITYLKTVYGEQVQDVKISKRLVDSPCLLLNPADAPSVQMEKIMRMVNKDFPLSKRVFEINPAHPLIRKMVSLHQADPASPLLRTLALQLLDNMKLREGLVSDTEATIARIQQIMLEAGGVN